GGGKVENAASQAVVTIAPKDGAKSVATSGALDGAPAPAGVVGRGRLSCGYGWAVSQLNLCAYGTRWQ
ncbi:hypothetical protein AB0R12_11390, partial [Streptomyces niveus]|uniref:hypothetical protein n=1 Tax=Streptomyces niveus TaxID=193462 RepID=UPI003429CB82